jgi:hypothetical protein
MLTPPLAPSPVPVFGGLTDRPSLPPLGVFVGGTGVFVGATVGGTCVSSAVGDAVGVCVLARAVGVGLHVGICTAAAPKITVGSDVGVGDVGPEHEIPLAFAAPAPLNAAATTAAPTITATTPDNRLKFITELLLGVSRKSLRSS